MGLKTERHGLAACFTLTEVKKPSKAVVLKFFFPIKLAGRDVLPFSIMKSKEDAFIDHSLD